jgi:hypothetical protein
MATTIKPIGQVKPVIGPQAPQGTQAVPNQPQNGQQPNQQNGQQPNQQNGQQATTAIAPKSGEKTFNISTDKDPTGQFTKVFARDEQHAQQVYQQQATGAGQFKGAQLANEHINTMVGMLEENGIEEGRDYYVNGTIYTRDAVMAEDIIDIINMQDWDKKKAVHKKNGDEFYIDLETPQAKKSPNIHAIKKALNICKDILTSDTATMTQKREAKKSIDKIKTMMNGWRE